MARKRKTIQPHAPRLFGGKDLLRDGSGLSITLLTGGRPALLGETLAALEGALDVLPGAQKFVYLNQTDPASLALLEGWEVVRTSGELTPIGVGYSALAQAVEGRWWLHLEDDWRAFGVETVLSSLREAAYLLDDDPHLVQVRLRYWKEQVLRRHMVTDAPIQWRREGRFEIGSAHWTFNPTMMRVATTRWFATELDGEMDAQRRVHQSSPKGLVAQLIPGAFCHIGADSLRRRRGRGADAHGISVAKNLPGR